MVDLEVLFENDERVDPNDHKEHKKAIIKFFYENKSPTDQEFHEWADSVGIGHEHAEEMAFQLLHRFCLFLKGGQWNKKGRPPVDPKELTMGIQVEYEHTESREDAVRIALDHLAELPDYYTRLAKMEKEGEQELGK